MIVVDVCDCCNLFRVQFLGSFTFQSVNNGNALRVHTDPISNTGWTQDLKVLCCPNNALAKLTINANSDQTGRTFQDRTHSFRVLERPDSIDSDARLVNYNVRGRRGNIVQVYPSVEYDFVPPELVVEDGVGASVGTVR